MSALVEGAAMLVAADAFWLGRGPDRQAITGEEAMRALETVTRPAVEWSGFYELDDQDDGVPDSPLGRLVAAAFDATLAETASFEAWNQGPLRRFRSHFGI